MAKKKESGKQSSDKSIGAKPVKAGKSEKKGKGQKPLPLKRDIELTVAYVGFGGNAGQSRYFYSFAPDVVTLSTNGPVQMSYIFEPQVPQRFQIINVLSSDSFKQIQNVQVAADGRSVSFLNLNSVQTLIFFTVLVRDNESNSIEATVISCDPQVGNDPQITPAGKRNKRG
ncbi:hypothetical protein [Lysobacter sp. CA199]|uniref:hypothetical protein n=1 Tax=Lysobacter sp. CA199 TaxID=3455608 RepID=UPI003F8CF5A9